MKKIEWAKILMPFNFKIWEDFSPFNPRWSWFGKQENGGSLSTKPALKSPAFFIMVPHSTSRGYSYDIQSISPPQPHGKFASIAAPDCANKRHNRHKLIWLVRSMSFGQNRQQPPWVISKQAAADCSTQDNYFKWSRCCITSYNSQTNSCRKMTEKLRTCVDVWRAQTMDSSFIRWVRVYITARTHENRYDHRKIHVLLKFVTPSSNLHSTISGLHPS